MPEGQIRKAISGFYYVKVENGSEESPIIQCKGRGVFRNKGISPLSRRFCNHSPRWR